MALLFSGHLKEGAQKSNEGAQELKGGAQASKGGAAPRYVALANSLTDMCAVYSTMHVHVYEEILCTICPMKRS